MKICKHCGMEFEEGEGSILNPDYCSDDCNYDYYNDEGENEQ